MVMATRMDFASFPDCGVSFAQNLRAEFSSNGVIHDESPSNLLVEPVYCCCTVVTSQPDTVDMTVSFLTQTS